MRLIELMKYQKGPAKQELLPQATDKPEKYVGGWESYPEPQTPKSYAKNLKKGVKKYQKVSEEGFGTYTTRFAPAPDILPADFGSPHEERAEKLSKKAPLKQARRNAKALSGKLNPRITRKPGYRVYETIRRPIHGVLQGVYEVEDNNQIVGKAKVIDGVIEELEFTPAGELQQPGQILSALLGCIIREADLINSNLSIMVVPGQIHDMKGFLERFGFRHVGDSVMRRNAGSIKPASVALNYGLDNSRRA